MAAIDSYRTELRAAIRGYWQQVMDLGQFQDAMRSAINRRLTQAYNEGAAECGVVPDDFTMEEWTAMGQAINDELTHVDSFADAIDAMRAEYPTRPKTPPPKVFSRIEKWLARLQDLRSRAQQLACANEKLEWVLDPQKENCTSCRKLNGQVRRASVWRAKDLRPFSDKLE